MAEPKPPHIDRPINGGLQNKFHPISQDSKESNRSKLLNQRKKLILKRKMN